LKCSFDLHCTSNIVAIMFCKVVGATCVAFVPLVTASSEKFEGMKSVIEIIAEAAVETGIPAPSKEIQQCILEVRAKDIEEFKATAEKTYVENTFCNNFLETTLCFKDECEKFKPGFQFVYDKLKAHAPEEYSVPVCTATCRSKADDETPASGAGNPAKPAVIEKPGDAVVDETPASGGNPAKPAVLEKPGDAVVASESAATTTENETSHAMTLSCVLPVVAFAGVVGQLF